MEIRKEIQRSPVAGEVQALIAVVRPILLGTVLALKQDIIQTIGGYDNVPLKLLPRLYRPGDGDCGICFEYAVHEAILYNEASVLERVDTALIRYCKIRGDAPASILFGAEKSGTIQLIKSAKDLLTDDSRLLCGSKGQPVRLKRHIDSVAAAFRLRELRNTLPSSIAGLWKADLFVGRPAPDQWVGTTVKINPTQLESARGLRLGLVPTRQGKSDEIYLHETKNLIVCPLPYDGAFMEVFYQGWAIVQQFLAADAQMPKEVFLPRPADRQVCKFLVERRDYPVMDVIDALRPLSQPELLDTQTESAEIAYRKGAASTTGAIIVPIAGR